MVKRHLLGCALVLGLLAFSLRASALTSDNLLSGAGFKSNLSAWSVTGDVAWSNKDVDGSVSSGSAFVTNSETGGEFDGVGQCVVLPSVEPFDVGARFLFPSGQGQQASGLANIQWYAGATCSGSLLGNVGVITPDPILTDSWVFNAGLRQMPPAGTGSAFVFFGVGKHGSPAGPTVVGYIDGTFFRRTTCTPADADLCLNGGRFRVTAQWESPTDGGGGNGVQFNDESGYFWFFSPENTEVVVKVHGACVDPFNHYWVFAAGLTNVFVDLNVEDTAAGVVNRYFNPEGTAFLPLQDTSAFATCP